MQKSFKRTRIFVSREIQGKILGRLLKYWLLYNFAVWHALLLIDIERYGVATLLSGGKGLSLYEYYLEFTSQHIFLLVAGIALAPFLLWDMLKLTHQIAGPLVRFRNSLEKMAEGKQVDPIKLRKGDLMSEFLAAFNGLLASGRVIVGDVPHPTTDVNRDAQGDAVLSSVTELQTDVNAERSSKPPRKWPYVSVSEFGR